MTLAQITALITSNIDTTGRRLTTGVKMREVLNGIVAYLTGIPDFAFTGVVFIDGDFMGALGGPIQMQTGGSVTILIIINFSRGKEWGAIPMSSAGDDEFTAVFVPTSLIAGEATALAVLTFDPSAEGTYTYDITAGGITKTLTIEVEGA